ncbi:putative histidine kinase HHK15p [Aureobasidium sp. EXF-10727]|nr:putative histidine kinase HHK15p [Aureobasidium sp. EXF-10727]
MDRNDTPVGPASPDGVDWTLDIPDTDHVRFFRSIQWHDTLLGPVQSWGMALRLYTYQVFADKRPSCVYWGPEKVAVYNEGFAEAAERAHPFLMGHTFAEAFPEICKDIMPVFEMAKKTKKDVPVIEMPLMIKRNNFLEETHFTGDFIPLRGDDGKVQGWYNSLAEVTRQKITDRRRNMLNMIPILPKDCTSATIGSHFIDCFRTNLLDIPLALMWGNDNTSSSTQPSRRLRLTGSLGVPEGHKLAEQEGCLDSKEGIYPLLKKAGTDPTTSPCGPEFDGIEWEGFKEPSEHACVIPLSNAGCLYGYLLIGANPRRPIDEDHEQFMRDLASQLSSTMAFLVSMEESNERQSRLENQLAASEHHIRYMADHLDIGLEHLSLDGKVLWANEHYFNLLGQEPTSDFTELRLPFRDHVLEEDQPKIYTAWKAVLDGVATTTTEFRMKRLWNPPFGPPVPATVLISSVPYIEDGEIKSVMACMTEVSRLKWAEAWQARAAQEAQEAERHQSEFTDAISHEVRNPLSAMLQLANSISGSLEDYKEKDISAEEYLHVVQENIEAAKTIIFCASHMRKILDDVLVLSKMDFMIFSLSPSPVQPLDLVENAVKMLQANISAAELEMKIEKHESISELGVDWVMCDPLRVTQILINLLSNAIKFTRLERHRCVTLRYGASIEEPRNSFQEGLDWASTKKEHEDVTLGKEWGNGKQMYLSFCVTDTGPGMTEEERARLFQRFQQASPKTSIKYGGTGLGLFISHSLTEKQNGSMGVVSQPNKGSTFAFYVKVRQSSNPSGKSSKHSLQSTRELVLRQLENTQALKVIQDTAVMKEPEAMPQQKIVPSPKMLQQQNPLPEVAYHVLLVEDNLINQAILQKQLIRAGCIVYVANHGLEALETLRRADIWEEAAGSGHKLDVVLMDLEMPVMDGLSASREIRSLEEAGKLTRHVEIIAITANFHQNPSNDMEVPTRIARLLYADGQPVGKGVLGFGMDGCIIRMGPKSVMKIPKLDATLLPDGSLEPDEDNIWRRDSLEMEKQVYQRLHGVPGLANCLDISTNGLELEYYRKGDFEDYIKDNSAPPWSQKSDWILQIVDFVAACHDRKVLWFDIALRNILLADDWTIKAIDFANSTVMPLDADLYATDWDGYTPKLEVLHVTNVIYSISRWEKFPTDCIYEEEWPAKDSLPAVEDLVLGPIIRKAWRRGFKNVLKLRRALQSLHIEGKSPRDE